MTDNNSSQVTGIDLSRHDADGQAYVAYYRNDRTTGFIWSGDHNDPVQVTREMGEPVIDTFLVPPAALKAVWQRVFDDFKAAGEPDGDHFAARAYRWASDAVNHANRKWESSTVNVLAEFHRACDEYILLTEAEAAYKDEDQEWFNRLPTETLTELWERCCNIYTMPSWDDEVYDALAARGYWEGK